MVQLIHNLQWRSLATPTLTEAPLLTAATTATSSASKFNISSTSGKVPIKDSPMVDKWPRDTLTTFKFWSLFHGWQLWRDQRQLLKEITVSSSPAHLQRWPVPNHRANLIFTLRPLEFIPGNFMISWSASLLTSAPASLDPKILLEMLPSMLLRLVSCASYEENFLTGILVLQLQQQRPWSCHIQWNSWGFLL